MDLNHGTFKVSRTMGLENWFALNKQMLTDENCEVEFPATDIDRMPYTSTKGISALSCPQSQC